MLNKWRLSYYDSNKNETDIKYKEDYNDDYNMLLNDGLFFSCSSGIMDVVLHLIKLGANNWERGLEGGCFCNDDRFGDGQMSIINYMIEKGATNWKDGLYYACVTGYIDVIKLMLEKDITNINYGLKEACWCGDIDVVNFFIQKGANDWNGGLYHACNSNSIDIVKLMIKHGANNWNSGLEGACEGYSNYCKDRCYGYGYDYSDMDSINCMIENGATDWDSGLICACRGGSFKIMEMMKSLGAKNFEECLQYEMEDNINIDVIKTLVRFGATKFSHFEYVEDYKLYGLYCKTEGINVKKDRQFKKLLKSAPFYILLLGRYYKASHLCGTNYIRKLPIELFRMLRDFL